MPTIGGALKYRIKIFQFLDDAVNEVLEPETVAPILELTELSDKAKTDLQVLHKIIVHAHSALLLVQGEEDDFEIQEMNMILEEELAQVTGEKIFPYEDKQ